MQIFVNPLVAQLAEQKGPKLQPPALIIFICSFFFSVNVAGLKR